MDGRRTTPNSNYPRDISRAEAELASCENHTQNLAGWYGLGSLLGQGGREREQEQAAVDGMLDFHKCLMEVVFVQEYAGKVKILPTICQMFSLVMRQ